MGSTMQPEPQTFRATRLRQPLAHARQSTATGYAGAMRLLYVAILAAMVSACSGGDERIIDAAPRPIDGAPTPDAPVTPTIDATPADAAAPADAAPVPTHH